MPDWTCLVASVVLGEPVGNLVGLVHLAAMQAGVG